MSPARRAATVLVAVCCLLAGCSDLGAPSGTPAPTGAPDDPTAARTAAPTAGATPSPATPGVGTTQTPTLTPTSDRDRLGWESGYAATDPLPANASDGLNASEREAVLARTMARVELIRGLEFTETVPVEVVSREEFRERDVRFVPDRDPRTAEQFWEALFLVGEGENATAAVREVFGGGVVGYYQGGRIVLVSDEESPQVDTGTLVHELVHALQDQHFERSHEPGSFDTRVGAQGLTEGDPVSVERAYRERCEAEWSCLRGPREGSGSSGADAVARRPGVYLAFVQPYVTGPAFVADLRNRSAGDWTAVNDAYDAPPRASAQVIHPERYPDGRPAEVTVPDRSGPNWTRAGRDTAGEAGVHVMFWANGFVDRRDSAVATDYRHRLSAGWNGDTLVAYALEDGSAGSADGDGSAGSADGTRTGSDADRTERGAYVWRLAWENGTEARQFERAYVTMLELRHGAREVAPGTYVTGDEPFVDAFRVTRTGETVTVVNAPTVGALSEVHAP